MATAMQRFVDQGPCTAELKGSKEERRGTRVGEGGDLAGNRVAPYALAERGRIVTIERLLVCVTHARTHT
jgi:hypothetical protein